MSNQPPIAEKDAPCAHQFVKDGRQRWETWLPRRKWRCVLCGFETRTYDAVDRMGTRPIHPHMSVAQPGFNTVLPPAEEVRDNVLCACGSRTCAHLVRTRVTPPGPPRPPDLFLACDCATWGEATCPRHGEQARVLPPERGSATDE